MSIKSDKIIWPIIELITMIFLAVVTAYISYDLFSKGNIPPKMVSMSEYTINPLDDLYPLENEKKPILNIGNAKITNLIIYSTTFKNTGKSPIVPNDFIEPLSVTANAPWRIITITDSKYSLSDIRFKWQRISDNRFIAEPALLNPGDAISIYVYITNPESAIHKDDSVNKRDNLLKWNARIVNLPSITKEKSFSALEVEKNYGSISVILYGRALIFTFFCMSIFFILYLHLLYEAGFLSYLSFKEMIIIVIFGLLSLAASESMSTYLFRNFLTDLMGVEHWLNLPPIIINIICLIILWILSKKIKKQKAP
jgi:hypothetical protein